MKSNYVPNERFWNRFKISVKHFFYIEVFSGIIFHIIQLHFIEYK